MDQSAERGESGWNSESQSITRETGLRVNDHGRSFDEDIAARDIAHPSPLGIVITAGESLLIRYVNPAFRRLLGVEADLVVGRQLESAIPGSFARRIAVLLRRVYRTGNALCEVDMRLDRSAVVGGQDGDAGGEGRRWRLTAWRIPEDGESPKGVTLLVREVSWANGGWPSRETIVEIREINQRLLLASLREVELTERAQAASEAKSAFLATMSHELRTPLTAILGYEELLAEGVSGPITTVQQKHLARIKLGAQHLLELIDGILSLSRLDAGRESVRREAVSVERLLDETATLIVPLATSKQIDFTVHRPESHFEIDTDHTKARQILVNLLGNAVKFTDRGEVTLGVHVAGNFAIFTIRDTGIGISTEHLERIFDSFWQVEQTTTRTAGGSGLGLSVSRRLARLLDGELTVESTEGVGSTFTLLLPLHAH